MALWFRLESGELLRLTDSFCYHFYARGPKPVLQALVKKLAPLYPSGGVDPPEGVQERGGHSRNGNNPPFPKPAITSVTNEGD